MQSRRASIFSIRNMHLGCALTSQHDTTNEQAMIRSHDEVDNNRKLSKLHMQGNSSRAG